MTTPGEAFDRLDQHARELDDLSTKLATLNRDLEKVDKEYQDFVDAFEIGLYTDSLTDGGKLPSEAMRLKLARKEMNPALLGRREGLLRRRDRIRQRIADLKQVIEAERSILSALRETA